MMEKSKVHVFKHKNKTIINKKAKNMKTKLFYLIGRGCRKDLPKGFPYSLYRYGLKSS